MNDKLTVTLPDGFNGHTVECFRDPIETDGDFVKLRVVGSHMIRWANKSVLSDNRYDVLRNHLKVDLTDTEIKHLFNQE